METGKRSSGRNGLGDANLKVISPFGFQSRGWIQKKAWSSLVYSSFYSISAHTLYNPSSAAFSFSGWKPGLLISQSVCSVCMITPLSPSASVLLSESNSFKLPVMDAEKSVKNVSANALPSQLELHALPGNFRSLNIVSQQIRDDEHAASPPRMLNVQLAGKRWYQDFILMMHWIK